MYDKKHTETDPITSFSASSVRYCDGNKFVVGIITLSVVCS